MTPQEIEEAEKINRLRLERARYFIEEYIDTMPPEYHAECRRVFSWPFAENLADFIAFEINNSGVRADIESLIRKNTRAIEEIREKDKELATLRAEVERLRGALKLLLDASYRCGEETYNCEGPSPWAIARAALSGEKGK